MFELKFLVNQILLDAFAIIFKFYDLIKSSLLQNVMVSFCF